MQIHIEPAHPAQPAQPAQPMQLHIEPAQPDQAEQIHHLVQETITQVYTRYYHQQAVAFFQDLHTLESIQADIQAGRVWVVELDAHLVATGTVLGDEILRMFVLPNLQHQGIGSKMMEHLEGIVAQTHKSAQLSASFPAFNLYLHRGYQVVRGNNRPVKDNHILFFLTMEKQLKG